MTTAIIDQEPVSKIAIDMRSGVSMHGIASGFNRNFNPTYVAPDVKAAAKELEDHRYIDDFSPAEIEQAWREYENFYYEYKKKNDGKTPIPEEMFVQLKYTALHWHDLRDDNQDVVNSDNEELSEAQLAMRKEAAGLKRAKKFEKGLGAAAPIIAWSLVITAGIWFLQLPTFANLNILTYIADGAFGEGFAQFIQDNIANRKALNQFTDDSVNDGIKGLASFIHLDLGNVPLIGEMNLRASRLPLIGGIIGFAFLSMAWMQKKAGNGNFKLFGHTFLQTSPKPAVDSNRLSLVSHLHKNNLIKDDIRFSEKRYVSKSNKIDPRVVEAGLKTAKIKLEDGTIIPMPLDMKQQIVQQARTAQLSQRKISGLSKYTTPLLIGTYSILGLGLIFPFFGNIGLTEAISNADGGAMLNLSVWGGIALTAFSTFIQKPMLAIPMLVGGVGLLGMAAAGGVGLATLPIVLGTVATAMTAFMAMGSKKNVEALESRAQYLDKTAYRREKAGMRDTFTEKASPFQKVMLFHKVMKNPNSVHDPKAIRYVKDKIAGSSKWMAAGAGYLGVCTLLGTGVLAAVPGAPAVLGFGMYLMWKGLSLGLTLFSAKMYQSNLEQQRIAKSDMHKAVVKNEMEYAGVKVEIVDANFPEDYASLFVKDYERQQRVENEETLYFKGKHFVANALSSAKRALKNINIAPASSPAFAH